MFWKVLEIKNSSMANAYIFFFLLKFFQLKIKGYFYGEVEFFEESGSSRERSEEWIWLSIDPVVHFQYSPYNAFDNNPVFWSDPSGADGEHYNWETKRYENDKGEEVSFETALASQDLSSDGSESSESPDDTYKVGKNGRIRKIDDKKHYDKDGNEVDKIISEKTGKEKLVNKGILDKKNTATSGSGKSYQYFYLTNNQKSTILFNWLATNTDVEFSLLTYSNHAYISTSFQRDREAGGADILFETVNEGVYNSFNFTHSHPRGLSPLPSGYSIYHNISNDKKLAQFYQTNYPNININWSIKPVGATSNIRYNYKKVLD